MMEMKRSDSDVILIRKFFYPDKVSLTAMQAEIKALTAEDRVELADAIRRSLPEEC